MTIISGKELITKINDMLNIISNSKYKSSVQIYILYYVRFRVVRSRSTTDSHKPRIQ